MNRNEGQLVVTSAEPYLTLAHDGPRGRQVLVRGVKYWLQLQITVNGKVARRATVTVQLPQAWEPGKELPEGAVRLGKH